MVGGKSRCSWREESNVGGSDVVLEDRWARIIVRQGDGFGGWVGREEVVRW